MVRIILNGACGRMGRAIASLCAADDDALIVAGVDKAPQKYAEFPVYSSLDEVGEAADVIIDFSHFSGVCTLLDFAVKKGLPTVVATTGLGETETAAVNAAAEKIAVFFTYNMSVGVNLLAALAKKAAAVLGNDFDIEIIEAHHNQKLDAPSGTALMLADAVEDGSATEHYYEYDRHAKHEKRDRREIGIHSIRGGNIVGEHTVMFAGRDEIIELSHSARSREVFATGAVNAAKFICKKPSGLYNMSDMIG